MLDFEHPLRSHAPFLVRRVFEIHHGIKQRIRRRRSTILGVPSPILSSVEENNRKLKEEFLGGKNVNDPDPGIICSIETQCAAEKMSDEDFVKEIEQGKLYIGKLIEQQMEITISGSKKKITIAHEDSCTCSEPPQSIDHSLVTSYRGWPLTTESTRNCN